MNAFKIPESTELHTNQNVDLTTPNYLPSCFLQPVDAFENRIPLLYPYEDNEFLEQSANGPKQDEYTETLLAALRPTKKR